MRTYAMHDDAMHTSINLFKRAEPTPVPGHCQRQCESCSTALCTMVDSGPIHMMERVATFSGESS